MCDVMAIKTTHKLYDNFDVLNNRVNLKLYRNLQQVGSDLSGSRHGVQVERMSKGTNSKPMGIYDYEVDARMMMKIITRNIRLKNG